MTDNQFDNFFREKLSNHTAPVPEGLWEKIRPEKEKRPKGFFLRKINGTGLLLAALLVGSVIIGLLIYPHTSSVPATDAALNTSKTNATTINQSTNKITGNNSTLNSTSNQPSVSKDVKIEIADEKTTTNISAEKEISANQQPAANDVRVLNTASSVNTKEDPFKSFFIQEQTQLKDYPETELEGNNYVSANIQQASLFYQPESVNSTTGLVQKNLASNGHDKFIKSSIIICPTNRGRSNFNTDWSFEVFASPDYGFKSVSNVSASQQYLDKKDSTESMQIGYSAGFRIVKPLNNNWLLKTGLQYSQINQKFSYRNENEIKTTTVITTRSIVRSPGDTVIVTDTSTLRQIGYSVKTIRNHYRSIDIPLTLGYQFGNEDLTIGINAGVVFNITSWYQGELLDTSLTSVPMSKISNSYYRSNIGMGLYSSISVLKRINENTHLFFEPYFRYNLSNMTNTASPYNQRFQVGGLAIGLRFDLNR
jgi:Outer membrane protein beta-barrel domain